MNIIFFSLVFVLSFETLIFFNTFFFLKKQFILYKEIFKKISDEEKFILLLKEIFINTIKLLLHFLIAFIPILIFFIYLQFNNLSIIKFLFSIFNLILSLLIFLIYFLLRKNFDKRKI